MRKTLAVIAAVTMLSGCGMLADVNNNYKEDAAASSEQIVARFHNDLFSNGIGEYDTYFEEDDDCRRLYQRLTDSDKFTADFKRKLADTLDVSTDVFSDDDVNDWAMTAYSSILAQSDYTINSVIPDDDDVEVTVRITMPDFSTAVDLSGYEDVINQALAPEAGSVIAEMAKRKGADETDIEAQYKNDKKAFTADFFEFFHDEWDECYNLIIGEVVENQPKKTVNVEYTVKRQPDGSFKIADIDD